MLSKYRRVLPILLSFLFSSVVLAQQSGSTAHITVNPRERFQFIEGFGVNLIGGWFRDEQKPMFDMLIDDLGATMFRVDPYHDLSDWESQQHARQPEPSHELGRGGLRTNPELAQGLPANWEYWDNRYASVSSAPGI